MGMDQQALFAIYDRDGSVTDWEEFMYWRKDYQLHELIEKLCNMSRFNRDCAWSVELTAVEIDAVDAAIESGTLVTAHDRYGLFSWLGNERATYYDFLRLARQHLSEGKKLLYSAGW